MMDSQYCESLVHYTRGMTTMFFIMWAVYIYNWRNRDRMTFVLFVAVTYVALCYSKDVVFIFSPLLEDSFLDNLVGILDITCTPLVCAFFLEASRPGLVTVRRLTLAYLLFAAFVPLYCVFHSSWVLFSAYFLSALTALVALVIIPFNVIRYNKYISENYSYTQNITVGWVIGCSFCYFLWFFVHVYCFCDSTWRGEVVFDLFSIVVWTALCMLSHKHKVVADMIPSDDAVKAKQNELMEGECAEGIEESNEDMEHDKDEFFALSLQRCMEEEKIFLNPRLSLTDLASTIGSNKTYLSSYINRQGKTFYDFINEYRIAEACRIIETKQEGERLSMHKVALLSGFNSISSFNRYFYKINGVTPSNYYRQ
ncbi:MAG: helix-turn-helix domain-containing protein [Prevotella sp.]